MPKGEKKSEEESAVDKEGQAVYGTVVVNYRLKGEDILDIYTRVGTDAELEEVLAIKSIVLEGFKSVTSKYQSKEIWQNRDKVKQEAVDRITSTFPSKYFELIAVYIPSIDFNQEFLDAINQKKTNEELALGEEKKVEILKYQADQAIETARGQAESTKINTVKTAEGKAQEILLLGTAQAKALELQRIQMNVFMVQKLWIDRWNGQLPTYMISSSNDMNKLLILPQSSVNETT